MVSPQNCLFMYKLEQDKQLFKFIYSRADTHYNSEHNSNTRETNANLSDIPKSNTAK